MLLRSKCSIFMTFSNTDFSQYRQTMSLSGLMACKHSDLRQLPVGAYGDLLLQQPYVTACRGCVY